MSSMDTATAVNREALEDFVEEALDSLVGLPEQLESYRVDSTKSEPIHAVFRAIHSMKGCAAFLELDAIRDFSHALENTLGAVRDGAISLKEDLERGIVDGFDLLDGMLRDVAAGHIDAELAPRQEQLLKRIRDIALTSPAKKAPDEVLCEELLTLAESASTGKKAEPEDWSNTVRVLVMDYISGKTASSEGESAEEPIGATPANFAESHCVCGDRDVSDLVTAIAKAFLAFEDGRHEEQTESALLASILALAGQAQEAGELDLAECFGNAANDLRMILDSPIDLDENLLSVIWEQLWPQLEKLKGPTAAAAEPKEKPPASSEEPPRRPAASSKQQSVKSRFVRVKEERLDEFLEHVSRLFITSELYKDVHSRMAETDQLVDLVDEIRQINSELQVESTVLQQGVMALRRVSISGLFSKFPRMARTLASNLGKQVTVHLSGEDTEIDKTLAEDLDAPLTHLIRNVVDHGIETPDERRARGVSETGNLRLSARLTKNHVRISVQDDGRGIDPNRLRQKAVEKGVISRSDSDALSDQEALNLIFHPGFSTAEKVSEVSGRGVGMDVVRTTLAEHDGQVTVESQVGVGTTLRLDIPIRQATLVIDGLMVSENEERFVIPFDNLREIAEISPMDFRSVHGRRAVTIRENVYDAIRLSEILDLPSASTSGRTKETAVLVHSKESTFCLLVDRVLGHRQVVVTDLKEVLPNADKMAGVAQLGGGRLALVLNVAELTKGVLLP